MTSPRFSPPPLPEVCASCGVSVKDARQHLVGMVGIVCSACRVDRFSHLGPLEEATDLPDVAPPPCTECGRGNLPASLEVDESHACRDVAPTAYLPDPPDGGDYLFCCEWVAIPHPGESTACTYCGSTFTRSLPTR